MFPYEIILQDFHFPGKKGMTGFSHSVLPTVVYEKLFEQNLILGILHILAAIIHSQVYLKHITVFHCVQAVTLSTTGLVNVACDFCI